MDGVLERPRITRIESFTQETPRHATLAFRDDRLAAAPAGTFCMVWVPGVDEVPMGLGPNDAEGRVTLTVEGKGDCTKALLALGLGGKIGVRGPYGNGFTLPAKKGSVCFVGGGTGIAPMARGAQQARGAGHEVTVVSGARSKDLLLLHPFLGKGHDDGQWSYEPCTDDGSFAFHGFTTQRLEQLLLEEDFDLVAACGPEKMMAKVTAMCEEAKVPNEASLERWMKCATGICDACTVGPGLRLCVEGPVLSAKALRTVPEYGVGHRDSAGILHPW
ncbi:MAG TPA: dihydroorotate dehydrogenase electron transfer subunit [Candidatus Thermoplasmatota archaeon]|nr:dihydroorotate dehydrogenase electron transfer subunit [Candidatus Thermoplasmatota archaeon]